MSDQFVGKWQLLESINFDNYMKQIGIGILKRTTALALKPTLDIAVAGSHWTITSTSTFKTHVTEFDLGKETDEETIDGRKMKSTFTLEDGKLIQDQKKISMNDKDSKIVRSVQDGKLVIELESGDVKAKRVYGKKTK